MDTPTSQNSAVFDYGEDTDAEHSYQDTNTTPISDHKVVYGEGLYIGYSHYDHLNLPPLFPFGHSLSYTIFTFGKPTISNTILTESSTITVEIPITNSGNVEGAEIVQAYIHDEKSRLPRPEKELKAFDKVFLGPGETKNARLRLDRFSVGYYDEVLGEWIAEEGGFEVLVGAPSGDIRETILFQVEKSFTWIF